MMSHIQKDLPFNQTPQGEVSNGHSTYNSIVKILEKHGCVLIGWTDRENIHFDIMFSLPAPVGWLQRDITHEDLCVTIFGFGAAAFNINEIEVLPAYIADKLGLQMSDALLKLAELINNIRKYILQY